MFVYKISIFKLPEPSSDAAIITHCVKLCWRDLHLFRVGNFKSQLSTQFERAWIEIKGEVFRAWKFTQNLGHFFIIIISNSFLYFYIHWYLTFLFRRKWIFENISERHFERSILKKANAGVVVLHWFSFACSLPSSNPTLFINTEVASAPNMKTYVMNRYTLLHILTLYACTAIKYDQCKDCISCFTIMSKIMILLWFTKCKNRMSYNSSFICQCCLVSIKFFEGITQIPI